MLYKDIYGELLPDICGNVDNDRILKLLQDNVN